MTPTTLLVLTIILSTTMTPYQSVLITKQATLSPNVSSENGATVTVLDANIDYNTNEWKLYDESNNLNLGLQLLVTLNSTVWGFHASENSTLTIEVWADTNTGSAFPNDHDLIVAFTQYPFNTYFATLIAMDPYPYDHKMCPEFSLQEPWAAFINGNVKSIVDADNFGLPRWNKACDPFYMFDPEATTNYVTSPLTFTLENHPDPLDNYFIFRYKNPGVTSRWCGFHALSANTEMNIYFAGNQWADSIDISLINVTMSYNYIITEAPTYNPTNTPTNNATFNPTVSTSEPTTLPTTNPTFQPTHIPTINPTVQPTYNPTDTPIIISTMFPSKSPSINPSLSPSVIMTYNPTNDPTKRQSVVGDDMNTTLIKNEAVYNDNSYIIIGIFSGVVIVIIIAVIIILRKHKKNKLISKKQQLPQIQKGEVVKSENIMTEMVTISDLSNLQSTERSDIELIFNRNNMVNNIYDEDEGDNNKDTEAMYDNIKPTKTAGDVDGITDKGDNNNEMEAMYDNHMKNMTTTTSGNEITPTNKDDFSDDDEEETETDKVVTPTMNDTVNINNMKSKEEVKEWLTTTVELPQYYDIFVNNGLNSLNVIAEINDNKALIEIGIELKGHRIIIMKYIKQLITEEGGV